MKVGLDKGIHAHWDIDRGVRRRWLLRGANIVEDSHIDTVIETGIAPTRSDGISTQPCSH
jgi:hypothetical protein